MLLKSLQIFGLVAVAAAALQGQTYWSTDPNLDCTGAEGPVTVTIPGGGTGYVCWAEGTFVWLAAGGSGTNTWKTYLRTAAPASAPIAVDYQFYDPSGNTLSLDTTSGTGGTVTAADELTFALNTNQPSQINLLGAAGSSHSTTITGSVWVNFLCPDPVTCNLVTAQLVYSALPGFPWSLSVPLAFDYQFNSQFWGVGIDDNASNRVSIVVNNQDTTDAAFTVEVFDKNGNLAASGMTPVLSAVPCCDSNGNLYGQGGTYGALLSQVVTSPLPSGPFKVLIDGGGIYAATEMLQINGTSATTVAMYYDVSANASVDVNKVKAQKAAKLATLRKARAEAAAKKVYRPYTGQ